MKSKLWIEGYLECIAALNSLQEAGKLYWDHAFSPAMCDICHILGRSCYSAFSNGASTYSYKFCFITELKRTPLLPKLREVDEEVIVD